VIKKNLSEEIFVEKSTVQTNLMNRKKLRFIIENREKISKNSKPLF
jgi:hypothetical protein